MADIDPVFREVRAAGHEGLVLKDPASFYTPGRRGLSWIKRKRALATLDVVVVAVEYGHGKRAGVLSDYTFAVRDDGGHLLVIGKAYTGLTDAEISEMTGVFLALTRRKQGRKIEVRPEVVVEVAFDSIRESDRHASGLALRFPRIKRLRPDKSAAGIDTIQTARALLESNGAN
jgi:DNA ligase-1